MESEPKRWSKAKGFTLIIIVYASVLAVLSINASYNKPQVNLTGLGLAGNAPCAPCIYFFGSTIQNAGKPYSVHAGDLFNVTTISGRSSQIHQITNISILSPGFILVSAIPSLPITLNSKHHTKITIVVHAPDYPYSGLLIYQMITS